LIVADYRPAGSRRRGRTIRNAWSSAPTRGGPFDIEQELDGRLRRNPLLVMIIGEIVADFAPAEVDMGSLGRLMTTGGREVPLTRVRARAAPRRRRSAMAVRLVGAAALAMLITSAMLLLTRHDPVVASALYRGASAASELSATLNKAVPTAFVRRDRRRVGAPLECRR
jgi:hypothetical protein